MEKKSECDKITTRFTYESLRAEFEDARKVGFEIIRVPAGNL